jgi:hypothetical protein
VHGNSSSLLVLLETEWVLRSRYNVAKAEIVAALSALLDAVELEFEDEPSVEEAVYLEGLSYRFCRLLD